MKKLSQNGFSLLIVIPAVLMLLSGSGYVVYERQQDKKKQADLQQQIDELKKQPAATQSSQPAESAPQLSEEEKILKAAACKASDKCEIVNKNSQVAHVVKGGTSGGVNVFVAKKDGNWQSVYEGNGDVPPSIATQYNIPDSWIGPQCTDC